LVLDHGPQEQEIIENLMNSDRAAEVVDRWALKIGASAKPVGPSQAHVITYRVLAETMLRSVVRPANVRVYAAEPALIGFGLESGFVYSQNGQHEWGPFAMSMEHVFNRAHQFAPDVANPIQACWVVMVDERPVLLVDDGGWAHDPLGGHTNLARIYGTTHSIGAVYDKAIAGALHAAG
jgi:hypothetical protein